MPPLSLPLVFARLIPSSISKSLVIGRSIKLNQASAKSIAANIFTHPAAGANNLVSKNIFSTAPKLCTLPNHPPPTYVHNYKEHLLVQRAILSSALEALVDVVPVKVVEPLVVAGRRRRAGVGDVVRRLGRHLLGRLDLGLAVYLRDLLWHGGLVLGRADALVARVAVVLGGRPAVHARLLGSHARAEEAAPGHGAESLLGGDGAAARRRGDHVTALADADGDVADAEGDLAGGLAAEGLLERPDVVVGEAEGLDLGELGVLGEGGQGHAETFEGVVERVHAVTLAVVRLHAPVALDAQDLWKTGFLSSSSGTDFVWGCYTRVKLFYFRVSSLNLE